MSVAPYTADQTDALQEIANIAMGQAGARLALMLDDFVTLSVPRARIVPMGEVAGVIGAIVGDAEAVCAVRQAFYNHLRGEALALFGPEGCLGLADLLGYESNLDERAEIELLLDVSNILVGAVMGGIGAQLRTDFSFSAPSILAIRRRAADLLAGSVLGWGHALLIEVGFALETRGFRCHLVLLMPEESIELMRGALEQMLEAL